MMGLAEVAEAIESDPEISMRAYILAQAKVLPNDERFTSMDSTDVHFAFYAYKKAEEDAFVRLTQALPRLIAKSLGTYWTWDDLVRHDQSDRTGQKSCSKCGVPGVPVVLDIDGEKKLSCGSCKAAWVSSAMVAESKAHEVIVPISVAMASAMQSKKPGDLSAVVRPLLTPARVVTGDDGSVESQTLSATIPGAVMMDERWGGKSKFIEKINRAQTHKFSGQRDSTGQVTADDLEAFDRQVDREDP